MEPKMLLSILHQAEKLKCTTRHADTSTGRRESVADHSWRLSLMAMLVSDAFPRLDMDRVIRMCLIHDLGESFTGDIPAFRKTDRDETRETDTVGQWIGTLPAPYRQELTGLFLEMQSLQTPESKLYKALDKLEALIQHNEAGAATWLPLEYDLQLRYGQQECREFPFTRALRRLVEEESRELIQKDRENPAPKNLPPEKAGQ